MSHTRAPLPLPRHALICRGDFICPPLSALHCVPLNQELSTADLYLSGQGSSPGSPVKGRPPLPPGGAARGVAPVDHDSETLAQPTGAVPLPLAIRKARSMGSGSRESHSGDSVIRRLLFPGGSPSPTSGSPVYAGPATTFGKCAHAESWESRGERCTIGVTLVDAWQGCWCACLPGRLCTLVACVRAQRMVVKSPANFCLSAIWCVVAFFETVDQSWSGSH